MHSHTHRNSRVLSALLGVAKLSVILISILMVIVTLAQVIFRYVIAAPLPWSEELARYCFVWIVFLGAAIGLSRGFHLGVDLFVNMFPPNIRRLFDILTNALILIFAVAVIYVSLPVINLNMLQRSPALGIQMAWIYIAIPVSMCLIALVSIDRILGFILNKDKQEGV